MEDLSARWLDLRKTLSGIGTDEDYHVADLDTEGIKLKYDGFFEVITFSQAISWVSDLAELGLQLIEINSISYLPDVVQKQALDI